ncbi:MAG TPA: D-alanyl-D-alanine carboxypeptidase/D-alanyl-D-alanine-endopeptidase [Pyrinomonadaceae bacterium]|jgi:D-alanyl-D-alanine carboxypeptidase/D-alanyl-D-alanine-endopeptidase (penicillin-binding protein 4)|nr:D-alanyl-D-alanine carboxypeptidase/D-alanyl-D-alanine-endopeptidase [Pyrinomonadaceae bacterium]
MPLKKIFAARLLSTLLLSALVLNTTLPAAHAQEAQRDRRVNPPAAPQSAPQAAPQQTPTPQAAPQATPTPTPALPAPRTLEVLRSRISDVLSQPALAPAMFGIKVVSLDTGRVLFEENAGKLLMPASNMKLYTVAAALDRLGPDFRFTTSAYAQDAPDKKGKLGGDLIIYGRGDPTYATRFNGAGNTDYFKAIDDLAARIFAAGVRRVEGDLVGDESYFTGPPRGMGWEWDDLQWYYGADTSALTVNDNALDIFVKPGAKVGDACVVNAGPDIARIVNVSARQLSGAPPASFAATNANAPLTLINSTTTTTRATKRELVIDRPLGQPGLVVSGSLPLDDPGYTASVSVPRPAYAFVTMLRSALERRGVTVRGRTTVVDADMRAAAPLDLSKLLELAKRESPPFSEIAAHTLKPSQNLYTELILRTLGKQFPPTDPKLTTAQAGLAVVRTFLNEAGVNTSHLSLFDGSGLARQNLITAESTVQLLTYMSQHRYAQVYRDAQPIAGVDGTLRGRMRNTVAAGNLRAKTGTLSTVSGLSGYVTSAAGERLVFSMVVNHYPDDAPPRQNFMDAIAVLLASFAGKTVTSDK